MAGTLKLVWGCRRSLPGEVMFKLGLRGERCAPGKGKACACVCVWGGPQAGRIGSGTRPGAGAQGARERAAEEAGLVGAAWPRPASWTR